jgi:tetratricopeptide (TPR) repeat protein
MDTTVEYWPLTAAILLTAVTGAALWLFNRQVARDKDNRDDRMARALASARKAAGKASRDRKPRRWVRAQMQLVMLLTEAGGNRPDRGQFEEALAILAEAIPILKAQGLTPELATAIYYRGRAEWGLGGLEPDWAQLEIAVATFRELLAIEPWPRHLLRGVIVSLPAVILIDIGDRKDDLATMEEGVALAREAVEAARPRVRIDVSIAQRNLSHALGMLGRKMANPAMLEEAIEVAHAAAEDIKQKVYPGHWAACQANLGYALGALGELRGDEAMLDEALSVMEAARESGEPRPRHAAPRHRGSRGIARGVQRTRSALRSGGNIPDAGPDAVGAGRDGTRRRIAGTGGGTLSHCAEYLHPRRRHAPHCRDRGSAAESGG